MPASVATSAPLSSRPSRVLRCVRGKVGGRSGGERRRAGGRLGRGRLARGGCGLPPGATAASSCNPHPAQQEGFSPSRVRTSAHMPKAPAQMSPVHTPHGPAAGISAGNARPAAAAGCRAHRVRFGTQRNARAGASGGAGAVRATAPAPSLAAAPHAAGQVAAGRRAAWCPPARQATRCRPTVASRWQAATGAPTPVMCAAQAIRATCATHSSAARPARPRAT